MKYFIRSLKYFVSLCVICIAILGVMLATKTSALNFDQTMYVMFHTWRYAVLFAAIVLLSAFYPIFGFITRKVEGDIEENRPQIINAFKAAGFELSSEKEDVMTFKAKSILQKLTLLGEDEITVSQYGQWIVIDGIRRGVARVVYRLEAYIEMNTHD